MITEKKTIFKGVCTALITPFKDGKIDYDSLQKIIEFQIEQGVDALLINGTTGESATLSENEKKELISFAVHEVGGRVPIIAGTGSNCTQKAIKLSRFASKVGSDAILVVTPYYNKASNEGLINHYETIANAVDVPIILYNVPSRTGVNLGFNLLERLSEHPNIVALKEASDSTDRLVTLASMTDKLTLYAGNDSQIYPTLALGGRGVISVMSNLLPKTTHELCESYFEGKTAESLALQLQLLPFIRSLFLETNPAPIKYAMSEKGFCTPEVRLPLAEPRESTREEIQKVLRELEGL